MSNPAKSKTIAISKDNYERLRELGHTPDSFNDVLTRVLKSAKTERNTK